MRPERLGHYKIVGLLGRGGLGVVYRAVDERTHEEVAVKLLTNSPAQDTNAAIRFAREFGALEALDHPNVVAVIDMGLDGDVPFFAMELIEGVDLKRHLDGVVDDVGSWRSLDGPVKTAKDRAPSGGNPDEEQEEAVTSPSSVFGVEAWLEEPDSDILLGRAQDTESDVVDFGPIGPAPSVDAPYDALATEPEPIDRPDPIQIDKTSVNNPVRINRVRELLVQVCDALAYIHGRGLVHRDLKPSNILVDKDGDARLMDFGLCKTIAEMGPVTDTGRVVGTYRYMSPEQASGETLDARSDLYSFGVILYELLTGRPPFLSKNPLDLWQELLESEPDPIGSLNPGVDYGLARLAHVLLRKDPMDRLQTAEEVREALLDDGF